MFDEHNIIIGIKKNLKSLFSIDANYENNINIMTLIG